MNSPRPQSGFSLIEVVITIGILMSLTIAVASMLRSGFEVKAALSTKSKMIHRLSIAMTKLSEDVQHTFFVPTTDQDRNGIGRTMKTALKVEKQGESDKIALTTRTHRPILAGAHESDISYVVYMLRDSKESPGRRDLYRGETATPPEELKDDPPMRILARNIKSLAFAYWNGSEWRAEVWDTTRSEFRNKLPRLVKITIEAWKEDRIEGEAPGPGDEAIDAGVDKLETVVFLAEAGGYEELKPQETTIKWNSL